ncbi:MAG: prolipoprotein diacylglyceryl transferase, partial [Simkaniaceae bacterium]|nr:prolipoprotein diacylglyceryl transferase [Simkaniaceae bacterium]
MIIKTWEGGLASHGGVIGIFVALLFFLRKMKKNIPGLNFLRLVDFLVIPTAFAGALIRIGNFCNQEILGKVSTLPWAIIFGHAADGSLPVPRHPVQIYEACFYMTVFLILSKLWRAKLLFINPGNLTGIFFLLVFTFRFMIEYLKEEQSMLFSEGYALVMGQVLSIPMIIFGALLVFLKRREWKNLAR